jgi:hypothetical protein
MKDIEILLRGFAMLISGKDYAPSMVKFLNQFSRKCEDHDEKQNAYLQRLFISFLEACEDLPADAFINLKNNRFNIALFEAVFTAVCVACTRFRRHRVRCFDGTGGESWRDGSLRGSSSLRLCG